MLMRNSFVSLAQITLLLFCIAKCSCGSYEIRTQLQHEWLVNDVTCITDEVPNKSLVKRSFATDFDPFRSDVAFQQYFPSQEIYHHNDSDKLIKQIDNDVDEGLDLDNKNKNYDLFSKTIIFPNITEKPEFNDFVINSTHYRNISFPTKLVKEDVHQTEYTKININCHHLEVGKNVINASVKHLNLNSNGVLSISPEWANFAVNLSSIKILSNNGLVTPLNRSWVPASVKTLTLSHSPMKEAYLGGCQSSLKKLFVAGSNLQKLTICLYSLEELDASWNSLGDGGVILTSEGGGNSVRVLKLPHNHLTIWTTCGWPSLTHLELQKNKLHRIDVESCPPQNLFTLNLRNNRLEEPPAKYPPKLSILNLSHNHIKKTTPFHRSIEEIDLSHNYLTNIEKGTFRSAKQLLTLDLSHNLLTILYGHDFVGLRELRVLDISHNALQHIRHETFQHLRHLQSLSLHDNNLSQLDTRLLVNLPQGLYFRAQNNPWRCTCHLLADLSKASKSHCKTNCKEESNIKCREGKHEFWGQDVLRKCIEAMQDLEEPQSSIHLTLEPASIEDTSEELNSSSSSSYYSYVAIPGAVFLLVIPFIAVAIRKVYLQRKKIKHCCNCLAPESQEIPPDTLQRLSTKRINLESDSETEF